MKNNRIKLDLTNKQFGKLMVISLNKVENHRSYWNCKCECGTEKIIRGTDMTSSGTKSCGCLHKRNGNKSPLFRGCGEIHGERWYEITRREKSKKLEFTITLDYVWNLFLKQERKCALSGIQLVFSESVRERSGTASLDRIDSSKGYVEGNVQWVHKDINNMKQHYDQNYFIELCRKIVAHSG